MAAGQQYHHQQQRHQLQQEQEQLREQVRQAEYEAALTQESLQHRLQQRVQHRLHGRSISSDIANGRQAKGGGNSQSNIGDALDGARYMRSSSSSSALQSQSSAPVQLLHALQPSSVGHHPDHVLQSI